MSHSEKNLRRGSPPSVLQNFMESSFVACMAQSLHVAASMAQSLQYVTCCTCSCASHVRHPVSTLVEPVEPVEPAEPAEPVELVELVELVCTRGCLEYVEMSKDYLHVVFCK